MDRRRFLAVLGALILARKLPNRGAIGSEKANETGSLLGGLFDHQTRIDANTEALRANAESLRLNVPSGLKPTRYKYSAEDVAAMGRVVRRHRLRNGDKPWN